MDFNERIQYELKKLDYLETMYWEAWEKSKQAAETTYSEEEIESDERPQKRRSKKTTAVPPGDPRFLDGIRWCIERRCQLLGLDAPKKMATLTATVDMESVYSELESSERQQQLMQLIKSLSGSSHEQEGDGNVITADD